MTNGDIVRKLSAEAQLALAMNIGNCACCVAYDYCHTYCDRDELNCNKVIAEWLQQEISNESSN